MSLEGLQLAIGTMMEGWTLYLPASMICLCYCGMILHRKIPGSVLSCKGRQAIEMRSVQRSRWKLREENGCDGQRVGRVISHRTTKESWSDSGLIPGLPSALKYDGQTGTYRNSHN